MNKAGSIVLMAILVISVLTFAMPVIAHYPGAVISSNWATIEPTIDGVFGAGEYADATVIDIKAADPSNPFAAYGYFKNDGTFLYVCLDASGDITNNTEDGSILSFDTGHDAIYTDGGEDNFAMMFLYGSTAHLVWNSTFGGYDLCCEPFAPTLPDHAGLAGAVGFGTSPNSDINHKIYEYRIPLALIDAAPGDTLGFALDGELFYGIWDFTIVDGDQWPFYRGGPIWLDEYGDLIIGKAPISVPQINAIGLGALISLIAVFLAGWNWTVKRRK